MGWGVDLGNYTDPSDCSVGDNLIYFHFGVLPGKFAGFAEFRARWDEKREAVLVCDVPMEDIHL